MSAFIRRTLAAALLGLAATPALAAADLSIELNKVEAESGACRVTMVVVNGRPAAIEALKADLVLFGTDGVVARRLAVDLGPVPAAKTIVKAFSVPSLACDSVGSILLNDLPACRLPGEGAPACLDAATLSSRAAPRFFK